MLQKMLIF